jgi:hypothetical protein
MSFTNVERIESRLNRSQLFAPGVRPALFEKAAASDADVICLDLEDSVAPGDKPQARANVIQALKTVDFGTKSISVRINGLDTSWCYRDVIDIVEQAGERLDLIMIPKVGVAADIHRLEPRGRDAHPLDELARAALHLLARHVGEDALRALAQQALRDRRRDARLVKDARHQTALASHESHRSSSLRSGKLAVLAAKGAARYALRPCARSSIG